jgi:hypothetical protein
MSYRILKYIEEYRYMIINESYESIINEMITDLKQILLNESKDMSFNYDIIESFYDINTYNAVDRLDHLMDVITENTVSISKIKAAFFNKHDKIIQRDKKWLSKNKDNISNLNFEEIELEVLSDYKVSFEQLLNRHNIFDKAFNDTNDGSSIGDRLRRFEDKNEDLKNGLDNYFRTGTSRREIGLRKVKGDEARMAVENMISYCESFLAGKSYLEEKMNNIIVSISDSSVKESTNAIDRMKVLLEKDDSLKDINNTSKELGAMAGKKTSEKEVVDVTSDKKEKPQSEKTNNDVEEITDTSEELGEITDKKSTQNEVSDKPDDTNVETTDENETEEQPKQERGMEDRQMGMAVLLSVAESRYFDYIKILKGLLEK